MSIEQISFPADGVQLCGEVHVPEGAGPWPVVVMSHGYGAVKDQYLPRYAARFAAAGLLAVLYDHRGFGHSDGAPRQDVDPWVQVRDFGHAISYARSRPDVDGSRLGVWGTSFSGGHVLVLGAIDPRVRAVVSQVPTISGSAAALRRVPPHLQAQVLAAQVEDAETIFAGGQGATRPLTDDGSGRPPVYAGPGAAAFMDTPASRPETFVNEITVQSLARTRSYEPGSYAPRISPAPLLMIVATDDDVAFTDLQLGAYAEAREPKELVMVAGDHFVAYENAFEAATTAATDWLTTHLAAGTMASTTWQTAS